MKVMRFVLVLCLPAVALAGPSGHFIHDVGIDSLRLVPRGIGAYLTNHGIYEAGTNTRLTIEDSTGLVYATNLAASIPGSASACLTFVVGGMSWATYVARCTVAYLEDENPANDTATLLLTPDSNDVGIDIWIWPLRIVDSGATGNPTCRIFNAGATEPVFFLFYRIDSTFSDSLFVEGLRAGERRVLEFNDEWQALPVGWHPTRCSLAYPFFNGWAHSGSIYVRPSGAVAEPGPRTGPGPVRLVPAPAGFVLYGPAEALDEVRVLDPTGRVLAVTRRREHGRLQVTGLRPGVYFVHTEGPRGQGSEDTSLKLVLAR